MHAIELAKIKEAPARDRYPSLIHEDTFSEAQPLLSLRNLAQLMNYVNVNNHTTVQENTGENTNNLIGKENQEGQRVSFYGSAGAYPGSDYHA